MILAAAVEMLAERHDSTAIPVHQIAKRAGLAKSVVYRQFNDREDLDRRIRSYLVDDFAHTLDGKLNISEGSLEEILYRTIDTVAGWMSDHPRLHEFLRQGPTHYDDPNTDAVTSLKNRIAVKAREIIAIIARSIDIDDSSFESLTFAVVTMVEGSLTQWVREPNPDQRRSDVVADLTRYTWYMLDGAARSLGVNIDPKTELVTVIDQLASATAAVRQ